MELGICAKSCSDRAKDALDSEAECATEMEGIQSGKLIAVNLKVCANQALEAWICAETIVYRIYPECIRICI